ncbi:MAG: gliding motility protein GldM [Flavisolibacter sp.]
MALPKEPRQKMINLMYLVLTALLALNVSAEILNAFRTVDNSLNATNTTVRQSTDQVMASLLDKVSDPQTKAKAEVWYPKAKQVQDLSNDMYTYIDALRTRIHKEAGFDPVANGDSNFKQDNLDIATRIMVTEGKGKELLAKLTAYKKQLSAVVPEFDPSNMQVNLVTPESQDKSNKSWEAAYFHMVPTVAAMTILRKFQNDVRTTENKMVTFCHEQVGKVVVRYDAFAAIVGQSSNYVMPGQEVEITAGVGAFSKAAQPEISINGQGVSLGADGQAVMKVNGGGLGKHAVPVVIRFKDQDGNMQTVTKNVEYTVGQANASIALDKMNVLYIGVPNPITVAASGGGDDKVQVSIAGGGGSIRKTGSGKYDVYVNSVTDECRINVSVDGKLAGVSQFRVRTLPTPSAFVGSYESGSNVPAGAFRAQAGIGCGVKGFPFDIKYQVTRFVISADTDDGYIDDAAVTGNTWSPKAQQILRGLKPGRTVTIDELYAKGPDGRSMKLPSLVYYIK